MTAIMDSVIGHRGIAGLAPENTLAAVSRAATLGIRWVELDVTLLADGTAVIFHDARLSRTTNGHGYINSLTASRAFQLDAGGWFPGGGYVGERIPSLVDMLQLIADQNLGVNLELKPNRCDPKQLALTVVDILAQEGFPSEKLVISSFKQDSLVAYREQNTHHQLACLFDRLPGDWRVKAEAVGAVSIHVNARHMSADKAAQVKAAGYGLYGYTVNEPARAALLKQWHFDGVFSDNPQQLAGFFGF